MPKKRIQRARRPSIVDQPLRVVKLTDEKAVVAWAREYFGSANELANGAKLNALRAQMGSLRFGKFIGTTLPQLGISRSTGYRWARQAKGLTQHFKNPLVRTRLMQIGRGRGILTVDGKRLTPSVQKALKQLPPEPRDKNGFKVHEWTALLLVTTGKARAEARLRHAAH